MNRGEQHPMRKAIYQKPIVSKMGKFGVVTLGSSGSLAWDWYLTDKVRKKPKTHTAPTKR